MEMTLKFISARQQMHKANIVHKIIQKFRNFENFILMKILSNGKGQFRFKVGAKLITFWDLNFLEFMVNGLRESFRRIILIFIGKFPEFELDRFMENSSNRKF